MTTVVGVRFREVGKIYYFDPGELELKSGDNVIVDTVRGTEFGTVMIGNRKVEDEDIVQPLKVVRRKATADDVERVRANREKEKSAFTVCKQKVKERGLEMKLISAEYTFDNAKILFYFTADGRVDFRELVKDLAAIFRIRIELRQVGVRDETKLMGGLGGCGRPLCCASYLSDFVPVSIRMAKEQNLSLNPQKISGVCGRLMCCLKNEADTYEDLNTRLPKDGGKVVTPDGREGIAESVNVLRERVRVLFTDEQGNREMEEFPASELQFTPRRKPKPCEMKAAKPEEAYDYDAAELVAEADSETDPALKALARAEANDVMEERDTDEADANVVGEKKRRRRRRKKNNADPAQGQDNAGGSGENHSNGGRDNGSTGRDENGSAERSLRGEGRDAEGRSPEHRRNRGSRSNGRNNNNGNNGRDNNGNNGGRNNNGVNAAEGNNTGTDGTGDAARGSNNHRSHRGRRNDNGGGSGSGAEGGSRDNKPKHSDQNARREDTQSVAHKEQSDPQQSGDGEGAKKHGTYRRFRKRRPKNTPES